MDARGIGKLTMIDATTATTLVIVAFAMFTITSIAFVVSAIKTAKAAGERERTLIEFCKHWSDIATTVNENEIEFRKISRGVPERDTRPTIGFQDWSRNEGTTPFERPPGYSGTGDNEVA